MSGTERAQSNVDPPQLRALTVSNIGATTGGAIATGSRSSQDKRRTVLVWLDSVVDEVGKQAKQAPKQEAHLIIPFTKAQLQNKASKEDPPESFLHMLPGELRNTIYRLVGFPAARQRLNTVEEPLIARAISSLRSEIHAMLFAASTFEVDVYSNFRHRPRDHSIATGLESCWQVRHRQARNRS